MWVSVQCAVQGKSHARQNIPCQDKTFFKAENGIFAASLADGAGSCRLSHLGAELATRAICDALCSDFEKLFSNDDGLTVKSELTDRILDKLSEAAEEQDCDIKDLSSTLLFIAVHENRFMLGHIGDGVIGYLKNNEVKVASAPDNGEFANTTVFTTSKSAADSIKLIKGNLGSISGFVLMSDGPEAVFYDKARGILAPSLKRMFLLSRLLPAPLMERKITDFFQSVVTKRTNDDCSMVIFTNLPDSEGNGEQSARSNLRATTSENIARKYLAIINNLSENSMTCKELAKIVHINSRYLEPTLNKLCDMGYLTCSDDGVYSVAE